MKKNVGVAIVVLLLVLSLGVFFMNGKKKTTENSNVQTAKDNSPKSLKELLGVGITQKCTYDGGTVYLANGKMRGDFAEDSHMIVDGTTSYIWTGNEKTGFKMTFDPNTLETENKETTPANSVDYNQEYNYDCNNWSLDASVFDLPKDVKFQDFSSLMPTANPEKAGGNTSQCGYCDGLDGDSKTQCLQALNCN